MALTDRDVALLVGQAMGLLDADVATTIEPSDPLDPYRRQSTAWTVWPMFDRHRTLGIRVIAAWSPAETLARLLAALSQHVSETTTFWAHTFPICPGHEHPATITPSGSDVLFTCPVTGGEVRRLHPELES
ncbi:MAG: hypothetical protein ACR2LX_03835 [Jatrophihabitans sp.]